ncbi:helicase-related protein [Catellatospora sp. NPDC049609]|uniref:helicase-related protein n=1 Tax=Catellatospora sp. NPDC049609 TaxID=3155505 RepID=UPI003412A64E
MTLGYASFLARKVAAGPRHGHACDPGDVHPSLHPWQARIVAWAVRAGRAAIWADTGLGKTRMQLEWARLSAERTLLVAPLAVCAQTVAEAARIGITARYVRDGAQVDGPGIWVTNYEMTERFDATAFGAVVLDESSILKDVTSKIRDRLIAQFADTPRRLACSATPAPNDVAELANHAEFLGAATRREMLSTYFIHDTDGWRAKGHAREPMFRWMASWAVALRRPSDIGYPDDGYALPDLTVTPHLIDVDLPVPEGQLFATDLGGVGGRAKVRRDTLAARTARAAQLVMDEPAEPWLLWCGLNDEADALARALPDAVNVHGSMKPERKAELLLAFAAGDIRHLITKPGIAAFGLNWQHCARMVFVGLSDSYEAYYQAIRRCWRYGQTRPVQVHIVLSSIEGQIATNVTRKERDAARFTGELVAQMRTADHWSQP